MQTFLPYPDMMKSLRSLDRLRLGKQRVESKQLLKSIIRDDPEQARHLREDAVRLLNDQQKGSILELVTPNKGWINHPARTQWGQNVGALAVYHDMSLLVWKARGYQNNMPFLSSRDHHKLPDWWGDERFHSSHRSNLLRKDPLWYGQFGWTDDPAAEYWWPSREG